MYAGRYSASVVFNRNDISFFYRNMNIFAIARKSFVYCVVYDFVYKVAQTSYRG